MLESSNAATWIVGLAVFLVGVSAFGADTAPETGLEICIRPNAPFFVIDESGQRSGLEYDLLAGYAAANSLGAVFRKPDSFKVMLQEVEDGTCEIASGTITVTEPRRRVMDFSSTYFPVRIVAVEPRSSRTTRTEQLRGKRGATIAGSTYLQAIEKIGEVEKVWVESSVQMFRAVDSGEADFLTCDSAIVLSLIDQYPNLKVTVPLSERDELAFAFRKGSAHYQPFQTFMKGLKDSGEYRRILLRYFDAEGVEMILGDSP